METYTLSKIDLAALKAADYLHISLVAGKATARACQKRERNERDPYAEDSQHYIPAPVSVRSSSYSDATRARCSSLIYFWRGQDSHLTAVVSTLKTGDEIAFEFYPDAHTNQSMETAGLHGDVLRLVVTRGKHRYFFEIDHSVCPENTARMCQGAQYRLVA